MQWRDFWFAQLNVGRKTFFPNIRLYFSNVRLELPNICYKFQNCRLIFPIALKFSSIRWNSRTFVFISPKILWRVALCNSIWVDCQCSVWFWFVYINNDRLRINKKNAEYRKYVFTKLSPDHTVIWSLQRKCVHNYGT